MPDEVVISVQIVLKDESDKEIDSITVSVPPGEYTFENLSPGNYTLTFTAPNGYYFKFPNPLPHYVPEGVDSLAGYIYKTGDELGTQREDTSSASPGSSQVERTGKYELYGKLNKALYKDGLVNILCIKWSISE